MEDIKLDQYNNPSPGQELCPDKLYEIAVDLKKHAEDRRDDINKFYISVCSALLSVMPFVNQLSQKIDLDIMPAANVMLSVLAIIAIALSVSWTLSLLRYKQYMEALESFMRQIEAKGNARFMLYIDKFLNAQSAPARVTKQVMMVPIIFMLAFMALLVLSLRYPPA